MNILSRIIRNCVKYGPNYDLNSSMMFYDDIRNLSNFEYEKIYFYLKAKIDEKIREVYL